ncbi:MAG TPA: phosphoglycolate phosphatase [Clostridiales bacterium]|nr:phosphoglycolate phosphatase [Clostridiales bacterium]
MGNMKPEFVVWDWNGTLLDDVAASVECINTLLRRRGLTPLSVEAYRDAFDFPVIRYYERVGFDFDREPFDEVAREYIAEYDRRSPDCILHPGVWDTLCCLGEKGVHQIVLTASHQQSIEDSLDRRGMRCIFQEVVGLQDIYAEGKVKKGLDWMQQQRAQGLHPDNVLYIGDTTHDLEVARAMGCRCLLYSGGHHSRERLARTGNSLLDDFRRLLTFT